MSNISFIGTATFVPLQNSLSALRKCNKRAILAGKPAERYVLLGESLLYQDCLLEQMLVSPKQLEEEISEMQISYTPSAQGALCCVALLSAQSNQGVLLCRQQGQWLGAYWPLLTTETTAREQACAQNLLRLAEDERIRSIDFPLSLLADRQKISDILTALGKMLQA